MHWTATRSRAKVKFFQYGALFIAVTYAYYVFMERKYSKSEVDVESVNDLILKDEQSYTEKIHSVSRMYSINRKKLVSSSKTEKTLKAPPTEKKPKDSPRKASQMCSHSWKTDWDEIKRRGKPLINLDPNRFIYPVLTNGPNNQLIGLRDTLYLAIRLNRTIILPHFYKHKTDTSTLNGSDTFIPTSQRIDVAALAALLPVLPFKSISDSCADGFDDIYFTSYKLMHSSMTHVAEELGVLIHGKQNGERINMYPKNADPSFSAQSQVTSDKKSLYKLYGSPGTCALYVKPYRTVGVKESPGALKKSWKKFF
uniref:uncharacterized protein LOC120344942 n=1 Tax=Styela clava TaxID=7725 RepID=UPI001939F5E6|nr:uncharacterized protein LOC120344942 [Styela clava]